MDDFKIPKKEIKEMSDIKDSNDVKVVKDVKEPKIQKTLNLYYLIDIQAKND